MTPNSSILIVDDDAAMRRFLARVVELEGYTPVEAESGAEAYGRLAELGDDVALVLLDVMMKDIDGFEFRELQLETPDGARVPTIVISGQVLDAAKLARLRAVAALTKPVDVPQLRGCIRTYARGSRGQTQID